MVLGLPILKVNSFGDNLRQSCPSESFQRSNEINFFGSFQPTAIALKITLNMIYYAYYIDLI